MELSSFENTYIDTRGFVDKRVSFNQAIIQGIASGGGLFVPKVLPHFSLEALLDIAHEPYAAKAATIFEAFGVDLPATVIAECMESAYGSQATRKGTTGTGITGPGTTGSGTIGADSMNFDTPEVAPVKRLDSNTYILELFHGPTLAFKDLALQCMPRFFSAAIEALRAKDWPEVADDFLILVATSGDTGKAALEGFADREHTNIIVYYPYGGVSDLQEAQMLTSEGANVQVYGLRGNFDDCQTAVKQVFNNQTLAREIAAGHRLRFSSANSINWGRLMPQIVYYVNAYTQMVNSGAIQAGEAIDVCVPTGNFGNILAAYYAAQIGTPIEKLICASNTNRVLSDFINTGTYDISKRDFIVTPSPSMDILVSSNLERQLFELCGRDAQRIREWMRLLREEQRFTVDRETFAALREDFCADWVSEDESLTTIREVYENYAYLLDPHTSVAYKVAERVRGTNPVLITATSHWSKFSADVYRGLAGIKNKEPLPPAARGLDGFALNRYIVEQYEHAGVVPARMAELEGKKPRFNKVFDANPSAVEASIKEFLRSF